MYRWCIKSLILMFMLFILFSCSSSQNPYETASALNRTQFKKVILPFKDGTTFFVHQGAFGKSSHGEMGVEYRWDLDVPYETNVISVDSGIVLSIWEPNKGGGCSKEYADVAHNIKILHDDGTVAQYTHVKSLVTKGQTVKQGEVIAKTAKNGWICKPHLDFAIFQSKDNLYGSTNPKTMPVYFKGIKDGLLLEGSSYEVPKK